MVLFASQLAAVRRKEKVNTGARFHVTNPLVAGSCVRWHGPSGHGCTPAMGAKSVGAEPFVRLYPHASQEPGVAWHTVD